ncbi:MAG: MBL fold metallo-hydrolase [Parachlamydiales bacterium]
MARLIFLGTGDTAGTPMIGCSCQVCSSGLKENQRFRPSVLIEAQNKQYLIDISPDFRAQALFWGLKKIDALLLTHAHYDHVGGLDELRAFYLVQKKAVKCLLSKACLQELKQRFGYLFLPKKDQLPFTLELKTQVLEEEFGRTVFEGLKLTYFSYFQKNTPVTGFRFGTLAYVTDLKQFDQRLVEALRGTEILILGALKAESSFGHLGFEEGLALSRQVKAKKVYLTHLCHEVDYVKATVSLPLHVQLAFDGLQIEFDDAP